MKTRKTYFLAGLMLCIMALSQLSAQHTSKEADFQVDLIKGCAPLTIEITNLINGRAGGTVQYDIDYQGDPDLFDLSASPHDFGSGNVIPETDVVNHTYDLPGTYILFQWSAGTDPSGDGTTWHDWVEIEVIEPQNLEFNWFVCGNEGISIEVEDTFYDSYEISFNDPGNPETIIFTPGDPIPSHTYAVGGSYNVTVSGMFDGNVGTCNSLTKTITTASSITPVAVEQLEVTTIDDTNGTLELTFTGGLDNIQYLVQSSPDGTFNWDSLFLFTGSASVIIPNQNTKDASASRCYRIVPYDHCNTIDPLGVPSETICSTILTDIDARESENIVSWETISFNFKKYEVLRNGLTLVDSTSLQSTSDKDIFCDTEYCYRIITHYSNGLRSISGELCQPCISMNVAPIVNATATIDDNNDVVLSWVPPAQTAIGEYIINRSENGGAFSEIARGPDPNYTDLGLLINENRYCYEIYYQSGCDNQFSEKLLTCAILLTGAAQSGDVVLNWTPFEGWQNGIRDYVIDLIDENGAPIQGFVPISNSSYRDLNASSVGLALNYRVRAISNDQGLPQASSNVLTITFGSQVFMPNAFTPNGDSRNDSFQPLGFMVQSFKMRIFNRWGELIFHTESIDRPWYGFFDGKPAPESIYAYIIEFIDEKGESKSETGKVLLIRD